MGKSDEREALPDILRGFAVILVVLGHCIQAGSGAAYSAGQCYFSDRLYQFIYSFHMPLFMMISGYLGWRSIDKCRERRERVRLLRRRAASLLTPVFLWTALDYARILITNYVKGEPQPDALVFVYFYNALNNLWFLWAVWWCFLAVYVMHYFLKDSILIYALGFLALFILPDGLGLGAYKYMLPYYLAGYYMHGYMEAEGHRDRYGYRYGKKPKLWLIAVTGLAFAGLFVYYNEDSFIYLTGYKLVGKNVLEQLSIDLYRLAVGFAGSCFFILVWQYILEGARNSKFQFQILQKLGVNSMGIYILSGYLLIFIVQRLDFIDSPSYACNLLETLAVLAISLPVTVFVGKIPVLKKFIGK